VRDLAIISCLLFEAAAAHHLCARNSAQLSSHGEPRSCWERTLVPNASCPTSCSVISAIASGGDTAINVGHGGAPGDAPGGAPGGAAVPIV
jgi:hypothetical protein